MLYTGWSVCIGAGSATAATLQRVLLAALVNNDNRKRMEGQKSGISDMPCHTYVGRCGPGVHCGAWIAPVEVHMQQVHEDIVCALPHYSLRARTWGVSAERCAAG
jgi:hypothetical protein